jgi:hypothetical protein
MTTYEQNQPLEYPLDVGRTFSATLDFETILQSLIALAGKFISSGLASIIL